MELHAAGLGLALLGEPRRLRRLGRDVATRGVCEVAAGRSLDNLLAHLPNFAKCRLLRGKGEQSHCTFQL